MMEIRRADQRGRTDAGWLDSRHSFSFADYYDPAHMGFRNLRVINEDRVAAGAGFPTHGHRDMEIVSYVLEGALSHRDSLGTGAVIRPGEVQRMSAGTGVQHSEFNASRTEPVHFLQIWLLPARRGLEPGYEQKHFEEALGRLRVLASPDGREGSVVVNTDAVLRGGTFEAGQAAELEIPSGRGVWVQVARGRVRVNGADLEAGDGAALSTEPLLRLEGSERGEVLVFELP